MNCLIVDDNKIARSTLRQLASRISDLQLLAECADAMEAYNVLQQQTVDLILLDIEMPGMSGLELTRHLVPPRPLIIFTTSKTEYAAEAFDLNVADYIVKPVTAARFIQAIDKAREWYQSRRDTLQPEDNSFLFVRDSNIVRRLQLDDILYAEAMGDYVKLHTSQRFFAVHSTLKAVEERLPAPRFIRVHRSYIVSLAAIDSIQDGALIVHGKPIPVADAYRAAVNKRLNIL